MGWGCDDDGGGVKTTMTMTTAAVVDQIEEAARRAAASLNREALLSAYKSKNAAIEGERDGLCRRLAERDTESNERSAERDCLAAELEGAREELRRRGGGGGGGCHRRGPSSSSPASAPTGWTGRPTASVPKSPAWPGRTGRVPSTIERPATSSNCRGGRRMRDAELEHVSRREMLERDLDKERELAALREQKALLVEDRCAAPTREMTELNELVREATEGTAAHG